MVPAAVPLFLWLVRGTIASLSWPKTVGQPAIVNFIAKGSFLHSWRRYCGPTVRVSFSMDRFAGCMIPAIIAVGTECPLLDCWIAVKDVLRLPPVPSPIRSPIPPRVTLPSIEAVKNDELPWSAKNLRVQAFAG